ncbi:DUF4124 domain-containing protein [Solimonas sp. K1W22B-7]|nr:DUF4124 domain-containing protein [Solimonas sp. K1W22B-7]
MTYKAMHSATIVATLPNINSDHPDGFFGPAMRTILLASTFLLALASGTAQAGYRCSNANGMMVYQETPCADGVAAPVSKLVTEEPGRSDYNYRFRKSAREARADSRYGNSTNYNYNFNYNNYGSSYRNRNTGRDNTQDYLNYREQQRRQAKYEQQRDMAAEESRQNRNRAVSRIDEDLRELRVQRSNAGNSYERGKLVNEENRLRRRRADIEGGYYYGGDRDVNVDIYSR